MEIPFTHRGQSGRVTVSVSATRSPEALGAWPGALGLANCTATIDYAGHGYRQLFGWVQLVRSTDNTSGGREFEIDPFDPFELSGQAPTPYGFYGIAPTLFDAPSRDERAALDWLAHSFLAASPMRGERRLVTPLLGFAWGFTVADGGETALKPLILLGADDWQSHLAYLRSAFGDWQFAPMAHA